MPLSHADESEINKVDYTLYTIQYPRVTISQINTRPELLFTQYKLWGTLILTWCLCGAGAVSRAALNKESASRAKTNRVIKSLDRPKSTTVQQL